jgi:hypothetical protein
LSVNSWNKKKNNTRLEKACGSIATLEHSRLNFPQRKNLASVPFAVFKRGP